MRALSFAALIGLTSFVRGQDIDPAADLDSFGNNTLFNTWRPQYHFLAPAGWMNDPCGAGYDPHRDEYHLMYQFNPNHVQWGNMSWGHAVSKDLITWTDVGGWRNSEAVALAPSESYDRLGIFSGTMQPTNLTGGQDGTLMLFYTSVDALPTNWKLPYIPGTESQSLALSSDGGRTWQKYEGNPVIEGSPEGWNITGHRDPFFELWPEMDQLLGQEEEHWYMVLGSGIKGVGPRMPLYSAKRNDPTKWTFLGALWEPSMNETFGDVKVTGSYGFNFEVPNFFSLKDSRGKAHYYVSMGAEGGSIPSHSRWSLWSEGQVTRRQNGSAEFSVMSSGVSDWGNLYAITAFQDTKHNRRVQWGWSEEDMNSYGVKAQGFQGAFGLPRELFVKETYNIIPEPGNPIAAKSGEVATQNANGTFTASTLGVRPLQDVVKGLRQGSKKTSFRPGKRSSTEYLNESSAHFSLSATLSSASGPAGFIIRASEDGTEQTAIVYDPTAHTISVDRSRSSLITQFANFMASGHYFAPLLHGGKREAVRLDVFVDGSLVEVFANDRFALTTRVYPSKQDATKMALYVEDGAEAKFEDVTVYANFKNVFPGRPKNSSSPLVWDSPEVSGNGTYWAGW
ncbi:sucrose-6-phosphate hydrolase [Sphaerosporella brunnea]|uniref:Sucrose-6-phosphate hydrolase n=1 Tax=Sphaerosporella brunnea TaxID=1250544 RepID=A0A5J5EQY3_9PEZI|nr:sucrose-6-phosphate hydrolase [Sphaerosporella brunnea]